MLFFDLQGIVSAARDTDQHFVTKMKRAIVPTAGCYRVDGQVFPIGKLGCDQALGKQSVDFQFTLTHTGSSNIKFKINSGVSCFKTHLFQSAL